LNQIAILFVLSAAAMGQAASIKVAKKKSQLNPEELRRFIRKVLLILSVIYSLSLIVLTIKGTSIHSTVTRNLITKKIVILFSLTIYLDTLRYISSGILRGLGNYKLPTLSGLFGLWGICMPCLLLLSYFNSLTFELSRILLLIGIFVPCLIQLKTCLTLTNPAAPSPGELSRSD
jgi:Na+-driven multidrug efflux pump